MATVAILTNKFEHTTKKKNTLAWFFIGTLHTEKDGVAKTNAIPALLYGHIFWFRFKRNVKEAKSRPILTISIGIT